MSLPKSSPLFREPDFLLREELREVSSYAAILSALRAGKTPPPPWRRPAASMSRKLPYYFQQLQDLGFVARRYPLDGGSPSSRQVRYELLDPLLRFWYRFVFPNLSALELSGPEARFASWFVLTSTGIWEMHSSGWRAKHWWRSTGETE